MSAESFYGSHTMAKSTLAVTARCPRWYRRVGGLSVGVRRLKPRVGGLSVGVRRSKPRVGELSVGVRRSKPRVGGLSVGVRRSKPRVGGLSVGVRRLKPRVGGLSVGTKRPQNSRVARALRRADAARLDLVRGWVTEKGILLPPLIKPVDDSFSINGYLSGRRTLPGQNRGAGLVFL